MKFIKTGWTTLLRKATIVFECKLKDDYYDPARNYAINFMAVTKTLRNVEYRIDERDNTVLTIRSVIPVSTPSTKEWLVIELTNHDCYYKTDADWEEVVAAIAIKYVEILADSSADRFARVEVAGEQSLVEFVITDNEDTTA